MSPTILLLVFGDLGDAILTVPAIRAIRVRYPQARIVLLTKPLAASFITGLNLVDDVIIVEKHIFDQVRGMFRPRALLALARLLWRLRELRPDTVVLFHHLVTVWGTLKFALLALSSGAPRRVGIDNGRGWFLTNRVPYRGFGARHEAEYWLEVASLLDAHGRLTLAAAITVDETASAAALLHDWTEGIPLLAIHPGTGWYGPGRQWPPSQFARALRLTLDECAVRLVVVGATEDREAATELLAQLPADTIDLVNRTTVGELAAVLSRASVLLANDSGVGHLAAAVGIPVVSVFGPSNDRAWKPLTATVVAADVPCRPCFYRDFERGLAAGCATRECLALVTPVSVANSLLAVLRKGRHAD
ncbi:MAG: glycosyltransferase family 9 protein [Chloroflexota bacterium]